jgi:hypothetical protein
MFSSKVANIYIYIYIIFSFTFGSKNKTILQLGTTLNNEASVLRVYFRFLAWWVGLFQNFQKIQK